jgi:hypothetical protein
VSADPVRDARSDLIEMLDHWKDGTRPGDDRITACDVMIAVEALISAMIERYDSTDDFSR